MPKKICALTLIELLVSMILMSLVILGLFSIDAFSRHHVINSDRRVKVQNDVSYALEYMGKYVQQSIGDFNNPPIRLYPDSGAPTGFQVRFDCRSLQDPSDLTGDVWVYYSLSGNRLSVGCSGVNCASCNSVPSELLSERIVAGFNNSILPVNPTHGFYVSITNLGTAVDIGLVGRYKPAAAADPDNPQISMKTRLSSPGSSAQ